jgi:hypothetical protein
MNEGNEKAKIQVYAKRVEFCVPLPEKYLEDFSRSLKSHFQVINGFPTNHHEVRVCSMGNAVCRDQISGMFEVRVMVWMHDGGYETFSNFVEAFVNSSLRDDVEWGGVSV